MIFPQVIDRYWCYRHTSARKSMSILLKILNYSFKISIFYAFLMFFLSITSVQLQRVFFRFIYEEPKDTDLKPRMHIHSCVTDQYQCISVQKHSPCHASQMVSLHWTYSEKWFNEKLMRSTSWTEHCSRVTFLLRRNLMLPGTLQIFKASAAPQEKPDASL